MIQFWLTVVLPVLAGTLCITGIGLSRRYALRETGVSAINFLTVYYALATVTFGILYSIIWGWTYPPVMHGFWLAVLSSAIVNVFVQFCNAKAASLDKGEVSLTAPLQAMTPGLITFLAITLGEFPGPMGIIGVSLMMVGSYVLLWEKTPEHWLDYLGPLRRLRLLAHWRDLDSGERNKTLVVTLALTSATLGTVGLLFDSLYTRRGVNMQGLVLGAMAFTASLMSVYWIWGKVVNLKKSLVSDSRHWSNKTMLAVGLCSLLWVGHIILIWPSYQHTLVAYVGTLKRFSVLFSVLAGWWFFRESEVKKRLWAGGFIVTGTIFISLDGVPGQLINKLEELGF